MLGDIWNTVKWEKVRARKSWRGASSSVLMKQSRLFPHYKKDREFRKELRDRYPEGWEYAAHWVDSAEKNAFALMKSWRRNYDRGERGRTCPIVKRLFARVKQTLSKLEGDRLRITVRPNGYVWVDLSKRYFRLPDVMSPLGLGEPTITPDMIHLPIFSHGEGPPKGVPDMIAWDSNFDSLDGFSPEIGWVKIDTHPLFSVHDSTSTKLGSIKRRFGNSVKGRRLMKKYRHREANRAKKHEIEIARVLRNSSKRIVIEAPKKRKMLRGRSFNHRLAYSDWRGIAKLAGERVEEAPPQWTSKTCSRCGWMNRDLNGGRVFECKRCGLRIDRQLNACIGIHERTEGVPHEKGWWDRNVLPSLIVGGYSQSGAEVKAADELARSWYETVKPQVRYGHERHANAYLRVCT
jgi:putative transposase